MKESTGELSMTMITIVAVVAIAGIVALLKDPIMDFIETQWGNLGGQEIDLNNNNNPE